MVLIVSLIGTLNILEFSGMIKLDDIKIAIVGLGYVGLPLAVKFGALRSVLGFDVSS